MTLNRVVFLLMFFITSWSNAASQPALQNDFSYTLEIPSVAAMESSAAHLYVLSESEGMAVFRNRRDSLQWLYTASGMQQRGNRINTDIRFAYLFGGSRRLTVLEPTSVMGAYSSTALPSRPLDVERYNNNLYVALGSGELGVLNLDTPETVDSEVQRVDSDQIAGQNILSIAASPDQLYAVSENGSLFIFAKNEESISFNQTLSLDEKIHRLFYINSTLMGSNENGQIFEIDQNGTLSELGTIDEPVQKIKSWNDWLIIKGSSNRLWTSYQLTQPTLWKRNGEAGNYMAASKGQLWLSEYSRISQIREDTTRTTVDNNSRFEPVNISAVLQIEPISDHIIPLPNSLLIPLRLQNNYPAARVQFSLQADVKSAKIRGQSLYWQPQNGDAGRYNFKVIASTSGGQNSSTSFTVDIRPFNSPPRFTPLRTISIPMGREFTLPINAIDPDGTNKKLIRYLGVNLPNGASIDEQTGAFTWTPTEQQQGESTFRVIATDQYGAASSADVTIRVIETSSSGQ